jgi:hypothetical protein
MITAALFGRPFYFVAFDYGLRTNAPAKVTVQPDAGPPKFSTVPRIVTKGVVDKIVAGLTTKLL